MGQRNHGIPAEQKDNSTGRQVLPRIPPVRTPRHRDDASAKPAPVVHPFGGLAFCIARHGTIVSVQRNGIWAQYRMSIWDFGEIFRAGMLNAMGHPDATAVAVSAGLFVRCNEPSVQARPLPI